MCGIIGIVGVEEGKLTGYLPEGLGRLYRRGHEGAGFNFLIDRNTYFTIKDDGLPKEIISDEKIDDLEAKINKDIVKTGIAHVRYRTSGGDAHARQPIVEKNFAIVHNGNIFGYKSMVNILKQRNVQLAKQDYSDTQLLAKLIESSDKKSLEEAIIETIDLVTPTTNLIIQHEDRLYVYVDPTSCHPLSIGRLEKEGYAVASETTALQTIGVKEIEEIKPGQFLKLQKGQKSFMQLYKPWEHHCIFEKIYVSEAEQKMWQGNIKENRINAGRLLWKSFQKTPTSDNIVAYAPDSAYYSALGFSQASNLHLSDAINALTKERGFLQPTQQAREKMAARKYSYDRNKLYGKIVYFIEDSIVRGTTLWEMVKNIRLNGVKELNIGIASSKIFSPCYYGMDFPTYKELLASHLNKIQIETFFKARFLGYNGSKQKLIHQIREGNGTKYILEHNKNYLKEHKNKKLAYDPENFSSNRFSLRYLSREGMQKAYGNKKDYCQACFTGKHWMDEWYEVKDDLKVKNRR